MNKNRVKMELIERKSEKYAVVFNVNLIRATLNEAVEFKDYLAEAIKDSDKDIIVNLSACEHLDSTFLGVLVSSYKRLKTQGRTLVIIEPIDQSSIFLTLNSIGKIFPLYTSVKVALEDIENKKLLENEINDLSNNQNSQTENLKQDHSQIDSNPVSEVSETVLQLESNQFESASVMNENIQELPEPTVINKETLKETNWNLIGTEVQNTEIVDGLDSNLSVENSEKFESVQSFEDEEPLVIVKQTRQIQENHFIGNNIKWEFGFSS